MTTRYDTSAVQPQGAYIAKQCPVRIQNDVLQPVEPVSVTEEAQLRMQQGIEFEAEVFAELRGLGRPRWVFIDESLGRETAIAETVTAMDSGAELIAGSFLPVDEAGRRTGKPDLLLRADGGYVPVDVKHHRTLDMDGSGAADTSPLTDPFPTAIQAKEGWVRRKHKDDALQLAHYRRMLEAIGYSAGTMRAGIIGKEKEVVWYDLEEQLWQTPAKSDGKKRKMRTTMEVYDFEFSFRLDIGAIAHQHLDDPTVDLLVKPLRCSECDECPWREHCDETLLAGSGDPSLLPGISYREWVTLRTGGALDRAGVAALHYPTAKLAADGVDLDRIFAESERVPLDTVVRDLIPRARKQQAILEAADIATVADLHAYLDRTTADIAGSAFLPKAILNARAATGEEPVYRRPGAAAAMPRSHIEIDIDMENTNDGTYLWGVLVTDRGGTGLVRNGYLPFVSWKPMNEETELVVFRQFWNWLTDALGRAKSRGAVLTAYCWHESAENTQMRRIAAADPELAEAVAEFIASDTWVDLQKVFKESWITGQSTGLKMVAPLAGYEWPVDDPGGGLSMVRHAEATADEPDAEARTWLLNYNRGDVEATLAIREWLNVEGASWPELPVG